MRTLAALVAAATLAVAASAAEAAPAPAGVTGMAQSARVELSWQPAAGATAYRVYRGTSPTTVTTLLLPGDIVPPDFSVPSSFADVTPANGTTYYYAVRSVQNGVESANSRVVAATPRARTCAAGNSVVQENCYPGDADWEVPTGTQTVDAYATKSSIDHGASVDLKVRSTAAVDLEIFRSGWYGGAGARLYSKILNVAVGTQPACVNDTSLGLLDCANWAVNETVTTTTSWPSGVYLVRVVRRDTGATTQVMFVVRDDARRAEVLYGIPDTTYQAYNFWGGKSLYNDKSTGNVTVSGTTRAVKVSFDRPYIQPHDAIMRDWYTRADYPAVTWLERSGYDVSYDAVSELERSAARLLDHRVFISGGHDEYYSAAMRAALLSARDRGVDLFFTGANELFWKVRFEPSPVSGRQDRTLVNYKTTQSGPVDPSGIPTGTWRDPAGGNQPENALTGLMYIGQKNFDYFPLRVSAAEGKDRIWRYTGLENQQAGTSTNIGTALVGWEWDARVTNGQEPPGVTTLASSPVDGDILQDAGRVYAVGNAVAHMTKYTAPSGSLVVGTGTNHWGWGLGLTADGEGQPEKRIRQATTNILFDMGAFPETPASDLVLDDPSAPPGITQRTPASNEIDVDPAAKVRVGFSRPMDSASLTASTFTLKGPGGTSVPASVAYDDTTFTATLTPSSPLALETVYTARLDATVRAANGIALGSPASWSFTSRPPDRIGPSVSVTGPQAGALIVTRATLTASAADNVGVASVRFRLDGQDIGSVDNTTPYSVDWDARTTPEGSHQLTAVATDTSGNSTTSSPVQVTVDPTGLVAAFGFEESSGTAAVDRSGKGNGGTISGATRSTTGRFGSALSFDGVNDWVTVADAASLDLTNAMTLEAWVNPATSASWRTALMKEQVGGTVYALYSSSDLGRPSAHAYTTREFDVRGTSAIQLNTWTHLAATYDGAALRLYVNGTQVSTTAVTGSMITSTGALRIGGNSIWSEWFQGLIDEVRVYRRTLTAAEIQSDMTTPVVPPDTQPPGPVTGLTATGGLGQATLSWTAATDNLGVARYNVHRGASAGFTPSAANRVAQVTGTTYTDSGMAAGTHYYRVIAEDGAGNLGPASNEASASVTADTTGPTVSLTAPTAGATVKSVIDITAAASDNVGVAGVQFRLDGADLGAEDTTAPYTRSWTTGTVPNGSHTLTAVARDAAGNRTTAQTVTVNVNNPPVDTTGLVGAWGFEDGIGTIASDSSPAANVGNVSGASWTESGRFGGALSFDGVNDMVSVPDADSLDISNAMTLEAWVFPTQRGGWRTAVMKERAGGLAYAIYSSGWNDRPSGHLTTGSEQDARGTAELTVGSWSHVALTWDGGTLRLYVNGTQVGTQAVGGTIGASTLPLRFGGNTIWNEWFGGRLDEIRVYRRALTATEVQTDMDTPVAAGAPPSGPETTGQFSPPIQWPLVPVHIAMLSNGKVAVWDGFDAAVNSERVWDPATNAFQAVPSGRNLFCAGHVTLPDGRLFIAGGHVAAYEGTRDTHIFNPTNNTWFRAADMQRARWYPTVTTLPDGRVLTLSGDNIGLNTPGQSVPMTNGSETLPEIYNVETNSWSSLLAAQRRMPLYPFMFVLPDGRVFDAGPDLQTRTLDVTTGQWTSVAQSQVDGHSAVMYRPGKILKSGTWGDPDFPNRLVTNRAQKIDMTAQSPAWTEAAPMRNPRAYHTLTSLPDGTVLASGGSTSTDGLIQSHAVLSTEIWDPVTDTWKETAAGQRPRLYHSSALLLPDGRVLLAGGGAFGSATNETNAEIFSPPYLFKGPRPTITSAPGILRHSQAFTVQTPDASRIRSVALMRMGSVTHNFDMDQRFIPLNYTAGANSLTVDGPANPNVAPPGRYMVFIVDDKGVPSVASLLTVDKAAADNNPPTQPGGPTATVSDDDVTLNWTASSDDRGVSEYRVYRSTTSGFTPSAATRIATVTSGTSYADSGLAAGTYYYVIVAADAVGNTSTASREEPATVLPDGTPPTVSVTAPGGGATVAGTVSVTATASDNRGVSSVQFRLDGANLGQADSTSPYSTSWDTTAVANGSHALTAIARDAAGNSTTATSVSVTVDNRPPDTSGLVAAFGFEEASATTVTDSSSAGNPGTISGATHAASGKFGQALSFDGVNDMVTVPDASSLDLTNAMTLEAWVQPSALTSWRTVLLKEQTNGLVYGVYANSDTNRPSAHAYTSREDDTRGVAQLPTNAWSHLAATFDGATLRLFVNGTQVSTRALAGSLVGSTGALRIGGNSIWGEYFSGLIDELRVYRRVLTAAEIQQDMNTAVLPSVVDTGPPTAPGGLTATGAIGQAQLNWTAATDDVAVTRYNVHRGTSAGFTPSIANRIAQPTGSSYTDSGLAAGTYYYRVTAQDAAGHVGPASGEAQAQVTADTASPSVSITAPAAGAVLAGLRDVTAGASDNVGVAGVQFKLDGANLGAEDTSAPYSATWDTRTATNTAHQLSAVARDAAGNTTTSTTVNVTVNNPPVDLTGLVAAFGFEEASGTTVNDGSSALNHGTIAGATRSTEGRFGASMSFDGAGDWITVPDANTLDLTNAMTLEAWVKPSVLSSWRTVIMKEQTGGLVYGLYANSDTNRPSAHAFTTREEDARGTVQLATGAWAHLAATFDGANLRIFVNGTQASSHALAGSLLGSAGALRIGGNGIWGEYYSGLIDEVRVYKRVLTAAEIQQDMTVPVQP